MTTSTQEQLRDLLAVHAGFKRDRTFKGQPYDGSTVPEGGRRYYVSADLKVREVSKARTGASTLRAETMELALAPYARINPLLTGEQRGEISLLNELIRQFEDRIEGIYGSVER